MGDLLDDHRRFSRATMLLVASAALVIGGLLTAAGRTASLSGLCAGTAVAEVDLFLLARSLSRFDAHRELVGARALTVMMMARFLLISGMVGVVITARGVDPLGVVVGVLLFPASLTVVGLLALRTRHDADRRLDAAAR